MSRDGGAAPRRPAPVLSVGALVAMADALPAMGLKFAAKVVRSSLSAVRPRQLGAVTAADVLWDPAGAWGELALPAMPLVAKHPALAPATVRLVADPGWVACPVRALRQLAAVAGDGPLLSLRQLNQAHLASFNPSTAPDGVGARLQVRDAAIVCVGYAGALRVEELARARLEGASCGSSPPSPGGPGSNRPPSTVASPASTPPNASRSPPPWVNRPTTTSGTGRS